MKWLVVVAAAAVLGGGCSSKDPEYTGMGPYRFGHTTRKDVHDGVCQPTDLSDGRKATWCFAVPPFKVGKSNADVDLYFLGTEPTAPLIEIQLQVRGCHEDDLDQWMRTAFGPPIESKPTRAYWKNAFLWAAALMPSEPGRCRVHLLPLSESSEIDRIHKE